MKNIRISIISALLLAFVFAGCEKDYDSPAENQPESKRITDKETKERIDETIEKLPSIAVYNENIDQYILLDLSQAKNGFNFASPSGGFSFSSPDGTIEFVEGPDGTFYQVVTPGASGGGGGGGVVTAGDITLNVSTVICFNSGEDAFGVDLFEMDEGFSGFSGAVGIGGDFDALMNMSEEEIEETDPFDLFTGFVAYYAFDGTASGSYDVIDFMVAEEESDDFLNGNALAFLFSFQDEGGVFFSSDGQVTFSGNSVSFDGTYLGLTDFIFGFDEEIEDEEPEYAEVDGFGALTCQ